jgi:hypothetical protein
LINIGKKNTMEKYAGSVNTTGMDVVVCFAPPKRCRDTTSYLKKK